MESPRPYFVYYDRFAPAGKYEVQIIGDGIDLKSDLAITEHTSPPPNW
jgi:hypothetical protein